MAHVPRVLGAVPGTAGTGRYRSTSITMFPLMWPHFFGPPLRVGAEHRLSTGIDPSLIAKYLPSPYGRDAVRLEGESALDKP